MERRRQLVLLSWDGVTFNMAVVVEDDVAVVRVGVGEGVLLRTCVVAVGEGVGVGFCVGIGVGVGLNVVGVDWAVGGDCSPTG